MASMYPSLTEGDEYRDTITDDVVTILDAPRTAGRATHELDCKECGYRWREYN